MIPSETYVENIRKRYLPGTRIMLEYMADDPRPIPSGTKGTVEHVDDMAMIHVRWDNGRKLAVIPGEDSFQIIKEKSRDDGAR